MSILIGGRTFDCALAFGDNAERRCVWCGNGLTGRKVRWCGSDCPREWSRNHYWTDASKAARRRDGGCVRCGSTVRLEVNHITPILGRHAVSGCHHHLDGIETLCHDCHVATTAEQRANGAFA